MSWIIVGVGVCFLFYACYIEPRWLRIRHYQVPIDGLDKPVRALVVADLQPNIYHWDIDRLRRAFERAFAERPDVVFWLGDYYNTPMCFQKRLLDRFPRLKQWVLQRLPVMEEIAYEMGAFKVPMGHVAVLGDHDWFWSGEKTRQHLEEVGISVLVDEVMMLVHPETDQPLQVVGYDDISSGRTPDFASVHAAIDPTIPQIALSHSPDAFTAARGGPRIMLSGHTHGGQVRLPFFGALFLPIRRKTFDRGWFSDARRRLFVSAGVGTSFPPMRFMVRPEMVILELVPAF
ncbi:MAG: metallophosphoesterase [Paracoccaceae bacterium]